MSLLLSTLLATTTCLSNLRVYSDDLGAQTMYEARTHTMYVRFRTLTSRRLNQQNQISTRCQKQSPNSYFNLRFYHFLVPSDRWLFLFGISSKHMHLHCAVLLGTHVHSTAELLNMDIHIDRHPHTIICTVHLYS